MSNGYGFLVTFRVGKVKLVVVAKVNIPVLPAVNERVIPEWLHCDGHTTVTWENPGVVNVANEK